MSGIQYQAPLYQFLGTLDSGLFEGTMPETKLNVAGLTQPQKTYLERIAFGPDGFGGIIGEGDFMSVSVSDSPTDRPERPMPGLQDEPTEMMPNGLPVQGIVGLKFKPAEFVKAHIKGTRGGQFLTAGGLGGTMAFQGAQNIPELASKIPTFDSFTEAQGFEIKLTREFVKGKSQDSDYTDAWVKPGALPVLFDGLSATFKDAVAKAKSSMASSTIRLGGQEPPPFSFWF